MPLIPKEKIEEIKNSVRIVEVIDRHVELKKVGKNYLGVCPFHGGKSFNVSPQLNKFKCFGCNRSGDAINFLMTAKHMDYVTAVRALAEQFNVLID